MRFFFQNTKFYLLVGALVVGVPAFAPCLASEAYAAAEQEFHSSQTQWSKKLKVPIIRSGSLGMEFVLIPPGSFSTDVLHRSKSKHQVTVSKPFYLSRREVTQEQYQALVDEQPFRFKQGNLPAERVNFHNASKFIEEFSLKENLKCRLPSAAEWALACRGEAEPSAPSAEQAWTDVNSERKTHPVGELAPNPFGLYDMNGNVWEWVRHDFLMKSPAKNVELVDPVIEFEDAKTKAARVGTLMGGAYNVSSERGSCEATQPVHKDFAYASFFGFRVLCEVAAP